MTPAEHQGSLRSQANTVATGALFGTLQWGAFFELQSYLSSTAIVYLLATSVWLLGSLGGLTLGGRTREGWWLGAATAAYYVLFASAHADPYDLSLLPLLLLCVAAMGSYAGRFFRFRARAFGASKWLFFCENCGFVAGMLITVLALYFAGDRSLLVAPAVGAGLCVVTLPRTKTAA